MSIRNDTHRFDWSEYLEQEFSRRCPELAQVLPRTTAPLNDASRIRGYLLCAFPNVHRPDQRLVLVVNVDNRGVIAIAKEGVEARLMLGSHVCVAPRMEGGFDSWRKVAEDSLATMTASSSSSTSSALCLSASDAEALRLIAASGKLIHSSKIRNEVGVCLKALPHPKAKGQFFWLVQLAKGQCYVAHVADVIPINAAAEARLQRVQRCPTMVPSTSSSSSSLLSVTDPQWEAVRGIGATEFVRTAVANDARRMLLASLLPPPPPYQRSTASSSRHLSDGNQQQDSGATPRGANVIVLAPVSNPSRALSVAPLSDEMGDGKINHVNETNNGSLSSSSSPCTEELASSTHTAATSDDGAAAVFLSAEEETAPTPKPEVGIRRDAATPFQRRVEGVTTMMVDVDNVAAQDDSVYLRQYCLTSSDRMFTF